MATKTVPRPKGNRAGSPETALPTICCPKCNLPKPKLKNAPCPNCGSRKLFTRAHSQLRERQRKWRRKRYRCPACRQYNWRERTQTSAGNSRWNPCPTPRCGDRTGPKRGRPSFELAQLAKLSRAHWRKQ